MAAREPCPTVTPPGKVTALAPCHGRDEVTYRAAAAASGSELICPLLGGVTVTSGSLGQAWH